MIQCAFWFSNLLGHAFKYYGDQKTKLNELAVIQGEIRYSYQVEDPQENVCMILLHLFLAAMLIIVIYWLLRTFMVSFNHSFARSLTEYISVHIAKWKA